MNSEPQDDLYEEGQPASHVGNGPTERPAPTKMENISAAMRGGKTRKVMLVTGVAVLLVVALLVVAFSTKKKDAPLPDAVSGVNVGPTPTLQERNNKDFGGSEQYKALVAKVNKDRAIEATMDGSSVQPLADGTARTLFDVKTPAEIEKETMAKNEAEAARASAAALAAQVAGRQPPRQGEQQNSDANYAQLLTNAQTSITDLLTPRAKGMQTFVVSTIKAKPSTALVGGGQDGASNQAAIAPVGAAVAASKTLISAGTIESAKMDTAVNTDIGGDLIATIVTGPYAGAKLVGSSKRSGETASIQFRTMSLPGRGITVPLNAVALDASSLETGTATDVDRKLVLKYGIKPLVAGIAAIGQSLQNAGTSVMVNGSAVSTVTPQISGGDMRNIAIGAGAKQLQQDTDAFNTTPTVKVGLGTIIGVMFTSDVVYTPIAK